MAWAQNYAPVGTVGISALIAALPVVVLLGLLAFWHVRAQIAALAGLGVALLVAILVYRMPVQLALVSSLYGAAFGLFPIGWIILNAIFIYQLSVETGQFAVLQQQLASVSSDRRIQALLIAFSFGAFIEGAAGFGAPVAITGALMIGLGFRPLEAAKLALIGNTAPVAFGALGTPLLTLARVTNLDLQALSAMVGRQLGLMSLIVPFWLVAAQAGWRGMVGVWPACLVTSISFATTQFLMSNYHGPWLVGIVSAFVSMLALVGLMRGWKPRDENAQDGKDLAPQSVVPAQSSAVPWGLGAGPDASPKIETLGYSQSSLRDEERRRADEERRPANTKPGHAMGGVPKDVAAEGPRGTGGARLATSSFKAWLPWLFLSVFVFVWGLPNVKNSLNEVFSPQIHVPWLDKMVQRVPPVVSEPKAEEAVFVFNALSATGTALLLAGFAAGLALRVPLKSLARTYAQTLWRVRTSLLTIAVMLALGFTTRYSGTDATMGLALAATGPLFPFFSPLIGWLGVALTGSDTSSNVLFGNLQQVTAQRLNLSPVLMAASNSSGGVMGKMIDAQSIVVASVATGGREDSPDAGMVLRSVFWHSLALATLVGILVFVQARASVR
ncbi:MAG TPA: L-lactate permease [Candidatus Dormibacteraeota bacterium]|nr:L-lactate permease [Candidatus Dormibacteraeota bacterium]